MKIKNITLALSLLISTSLLPSLSMASITTGTNPSPNDVKVKPFFCDVYLFKRNPTTGNDLVLISSKKQSMRMFHFKNNGTSIIYDGMPISFPVWENEGLVRVARKGEVIITEFDHGDLFSLSSEGNPSEVLMIGGCHQPK